MLLTSVDYLPKVTSVGVFAFWGCLSLTSVNLSEALTIRTSAFYSCSKLTGVTAPNVTKVENYTYYGCALLTSVDYLPNVTSVGVEAFGYCGALTSVDLPVAGTIGNQAFWDCTGLQTVKFGYPNTMVSWGTDVFRNVTTGNLALYLGADELSSVVSGTIWRGYTWKSISSYP